MRTVYLSDESFDEIGAVLAAAMDGQDVMIQVLASRFGVESAQVQAERAKLERMLEADRSMRKEEQ